MAEKLQICKNILEVLIPGGETLKILRTKSPKLIENEAKTKEVPKQEIANINLNTTPGVPDEKTPLSGKLEKGIASTKGLAAPELINSGQNFSVQEPKVFFTNFLQQPLQPQQSHQQLQQQQRLECKPSIPSNLASSSEGPPKFRPTVTANTTESNNKTAVPTQKMQYQCSQRRENYPQQPQIQHAQNRPPQQPPVHPQMKPFSGTGPLPPYPSHHLHSNLNAPQFHSNKPAPLIIQNGPPLFFHQSQQVPYLQNRGPPLPQPNHQFPIPLNSRGPSNSLSVYPLRASEQNSSPNLLTHSRAPSTSGPMPSKNFDYRQTNFNKHINNNNKYP